MKRSIYHEVTNEILEFMKEGSLPWEIPFSGTTSIMLPKNFSTQNEYRGINYWNLLIKSMKSGFLSNAWMTFKQAQDLGYSIRSGAKGSKVVYFNMIDSCESKDDETEKNKKIPILKLTSVFNLSQINGFEEEILKNQNIEKKNLILRNLALHN